MFKNLFIRWLFLYFIPASMGGAIGATVAKNCGLVYDVDNIPSYCKYIYNEDILKKK